MEYVDGANLRQLMRDGKLSPREALALVPQLCEALQAAHEEGVVHRDVKPENILIDRRGRAKVADFGLAKIAGRPAGDVSLTAPEQAVGTLHYMAPEQVRGARAVDHRADIYSLGVVFYELLTGELPLGKFAPPSSRVQIDVRLDRVVLRALEPEPDRRYQNAGDVKADLDAVGGGPAADLPAAPPAAPVPGRKLRAFFRLLASFNLVVLLVAASLCRKTVLWGYEPALFRRIEATVRWDLLVPIVAGTLVLSAGAYVCVATWLGVGAYPGRERQPSRRLRLRDRLFATAEGWALILCLFGVVPNGLHPWAYVWFRRAPAFLGDGVVAYPAGASELGLVVLGLFAALGLLVIASGATRLLPRCPPRLILLTGVAVVLLSALYVATNFDETTVSVGQKPFFRPWSFAVMWPTPGNEARITLTVMPFLSAVFGLGLVACGVVAARRPRAPAPDAAGGL
jgi:hypothetical protein